MRDEREGPGVTDLDRADEVLDALANAVATYAAAAIAESKRREAPWGGLFLGRGSDWGTAADRLRLIAHAVIRSIEHADEQAAISSAHANEVRSLSNAGSKLP